MREFTNEEIRMLAKQEEEMDRGAQPFVILDGRRLAMTPEAMKEFDLKQGQTINHVINLAILNFQVSWLTDKIAERDAQKISDEEFNAAIATSALRRVAGAAGLDEDGKPLPPLDNESGLS